MEELIKQLNEKEIYVYGEIRNENKIFQISLYTQPDREIITIKLENFLYYMEVSLFSTHVHFEERHSKVYEYGKDIIYDFIINEFQKSDCLLLFYRSETNHIFKTKGFSLKNYFEQSQPKALSFININSLPLYYCIEKYPRALTKILDFSSKMNNVLEQINEENQMFSFSFNSDFRRMKLEFYYKGVNSRVKVFCKEHSLIFRYEKYDKGIEKIKREDKEFPFSSQNELLDIVKKYMEFHYKKERLRLVSQPSRYYFTRAQLGSGLIYPELLYNALLSHFSPEELEHYSYHLYSEKKYSIGTRGSYKDNEHFSLGLYQFGEFWFVLKQKEDETTEPALFLYSSEQEARSSFQSLLLEKIGIS